MESVAETALCYIHANQRLPRLRMFGALHVRSRRALAIVCVWLVLGFAVRNVVTVIEGMQHALHIGHEASELAGAVQICTETNDICETGSESDTGRAHAHSATDSSVKPIVGTEELAVTIEFHVARFEMGNERVGRGRGQLAPDRPPKN